MSVDPFLVWPENFSLGKVYALELSQGVSIIIFSESTAGPRPPYVRTVQLLHYQRRPRVAFVSTCYI